MIASQTLAATAIDAWPAVFFQGDGAEERW
jgi:hypothetical protein